MTRLAVVLAIGLLAAGCGGGSHQSETTQARPTAATTSTASAATGAKVTQPRAASTKRISPMAAVRSALAANHRLVVRVL